MTTPNLPAGHFAAGSLPGLLRPGLAELYDGIGLGEHGES